MVIVLPRVARKHDWKTTYAEFSLPSTCPNRFSQCYSQRGFWNYQNMQVMFKLFIAIVYCSSLASCWVINWGPFLLKRIFEIAKCWKKLHLFDNPSTALKLLPVSLLDCCNSLQILFVISHLIPYLKKHTIQILIPTSKTLLKRGIKINISHPYNAFRWLMIPQAAQMPFHPFYICPKWEDTEQTI